MTGAELLARARVVLVRPQLAVNVGSAARVMRNLGLPGSGAWKPGRATIPTPRSRCQPQGFGDRVQSAG